MSTHSPMGPSNPGLHKIHAAHDRTARGWRVDVGPVTVRLEGGDVLTKRAIAYRLAVCWNICEGIPTDKLMDGVLRDYHAAVDELLTACAHTATQAFADSALLEAAQKVREAAKRVGVEDFYCSACDPKKETTT